MYIDFIQKYVPKESKEMIREVITSELKNSFSDVCLFPLNTMKSKGDLRETPIPKVLNKFMRPKSILF